MFLTCESHKFQIEISI